MDKLTREQFGEEFRWGVAHASYQVEGAWDEDGKGLSIWDTFTARRRTIRDRSDGRVACDFYHRYEGDTALVADLGFDAQRFSISWPRIMPNGTGSVNTAGLDFYDRLVDTCLAEGVEPWPTLYHWDLPQALQDRGGWANRDSVEWFAEYTAAVVERLGDRVTNWMVFNEPCSFILGGYLAGVHAPGIRSLSKALATIHHVNLAQASGAAALRAARSGLSVGTCHIITPMQTNAESERHRRAAASMDAWANRVFIEPNFGLGYPVDDAPLLKRVERYIRPGDDEAIRVDWDFLGVQYYQRLLAIPVPVPGLRGIPWMRKDHRNYEVTAMGWEVQPDGLYEALQKVHAYDWDLPLLVTENGMAVPDRLVDGRVHDPRRTAFYQAHLAEVLRARDAGVPVEGYFAWSLMDNFEWAEGYEPRFGLVYVDFDTQTRTVKDSGRWFQRFLGAASQT